jgi:hypothetical protein
MEEEMKTTIGMIVRLFEYFSINLVVLKSFDLITWTWMQSLYPMLTLFIFGFALGIAEGRKK